MTSISSLGSSNAWSSAIQSQRSQQSAKLAEKLSANFDADGNGSLNETELQSLMDDIGSRTGQSGGSSAKDLLSSSDSNADGSLSTDELEAALPSMLPPPRSTMDFAQSRGAGQSDDLFSKVDSDGSGDVSSDELTALLHQALADQNAERGAGEALAERVAQVHPLAGVRRPPSLCDHLTVPGDHQRVRTVAGSFEGVQQGEQTTGVHALGRRGAARHRHGGRRGK